LQFQQNLSNLPIAVLVLAAKSNRMESRRPLIPGLLTALKKLKPRTLARVVAQD
jgi:hypothetical protein